MRTYTHKSLDVRARGPLSISRCFLPLCPLKAAAFHKGLWLSCLLISPSSPLHTGVMLVRKAKSACSHADASLKLSVTQPAAHQFSHLWKAQAWGPLPRSPLFPTDINLPHSWLASPSWIELLSPFVCSDGCFYTDAPHHLPFSPASGPQSHLLHQAGPRRGQGPQNAPSLKAQGWNVPDSKQAQRDSPIPCSGDGNIGCPVNRCSVPVAF